MVRMFNDDLFTVLDLLKHTAKMAIVSIDKMVETISPAVGIGVDTIPISRCKSLMKLIVVRLLESLCCKIPSETTPRSLIWPCGNPPVHGARGKRVSIRPTEIGFTEREISSGKACGKRLSLGRHGMQNGDQKV